MRPYDPQQPLIFIHVPKTAGTSVRRVFGELFAGRVHHHYYDEAAGGLPIKRDLSALCRAGQTPILFGHFNKNRGFGVVDYYPDVSQFVTILRDPFEMHLSRYFYTKQRQNVWQRKSDVDELGLEQFVQEGHLNMLEHFPRNMTFQSFKSDLEEQFVDIGCVETLPVSLARITGRLGVPLGNLTVPELNVTERARVDNFEHLRSLFRDRWPLEHAIYDYARSINSSFG